MKRATCLAGAGLLLAALMPAAATAAVTGPIGMNLTPSTQTVSGNIYKTADRPHAHYRHDVWGTPQNSVMSLNWCSDYSVYVSDWYGAGDSSYHTLGTNWITGTCLRLRGRTTTAPTFASYGYVLH